MTNQQTAFDPAEVPIHYTLNLPQVNLILECMAELPRKQTDGFFEQFRDTAVQALQTAEKAHYDAIADQAKKSEVSKSPEQPPIDPAAIAD